MGLEMSGLWTDWQEDVPDGRDVDCEGNVPDRNVDCVEDVPEVWEDALVYGTRDVWVMNWLAGSIKILLNQL